MLIWDELESKRQRRDGRGGDVSAKTFKVMDVLGRSWWRVANRSERWVLFV